MATLILGNTKNFGKVVDKYVSPSEYKPVRAFFSSPFMFPRYLLEVKKDAELLKHMGLHDGYGKAAMKDLYLNTHSIRASKAQNYSTQEIMLAINKTVLDFKKEMTIFPSLAKVELVVPNPLGEKKYYVDLRKLHLLITSILHASHKQNAASDLWMCVENDRPYLKITISPGIWAGGRDRGFTHFLSSSMAVSREFCEVSISHEVAKIFLLPGL